MRLLPAVISPFSFVFFLYQRTKPPQRSVLFINLLGTRLTPRASMGDEAPSDGLLRSGVRRNSNVCPSTAPAHLGNTNCLLIHAVSFTTRLGNSVCRVDIPSFPSNVWTLVALFTGVVPLYFSFKRVATFTGGPFLAPVRTVPLFQSCKSAFCFRFFYVAAVKQKLACSEEIFTKESLFSVTLTAKARTHC